MGWNTSAVLIKASIDDTAEQFLEWLGFPNSRFVRTVSFDEAASADLPGRAMGACKEWTAIFDPEVFGLFSGAPVADGFLPASFEQALAELSQQAEVFCFMLASTSDTAAFAHFSGGQRLRCLLKQEGLAVIDKGEPSESESAAMFENTDMEEAVFALAGHLGFDLFAEPQPSYSLFSFGS